MTLEVGKVYTLKMNSGEEMIAKVTKLVSETLVELENPVSVAPGPKGMGLVPSMFTADPDIPVTINTNAVSMYCITDDSVKNKYIEATTGIQLPEKKLILG